MILAFCLGDIDEPMVLDGRFGRAHRFAIVEAYPGKDAGKVLRIVENTGRDSSSSAGTGAIQILVNEGVEGIVAPHLGPKAEDARRSLGIKLWSQGTNTVLEKAVLAWSAGKLEDLSEAPLPQGLRRA